MSTQLQVKERPILFSGPMVRALLDGSKTQTRRIVKPEIEHVADGPKNGKWYFRRPDGILNSFETREELAARHCPYGQPGERLWVRETCKAAELQDGTDGVHYVADGRFLPLLDDGTIEGNKVAAQRWLDLYWYRNIKGSTVPGIHMPRWASRILLEIVSVRVERLQAISEAEAIAEGIEPYDGGGVYKLYGSERPSSIGTVAATRTDYVQPVESYKSLWESINGPDSWQANPWVWVVEFRRVAP